MRAKFVSEAFSQKSDPIKDMGIGVAPKRYRKGDKVKYQYWHKASEMSATSKPERAEDKIGRISKVKKGFMGRIEYEIDGLTVPASYIISKVNEVIAQPFTNNTRNQPIRGSYPLTKIQYEDKDKPDFSDWDMPIPCPNCNREIHAGEFVDGVCKKCAEQGIYFDGFGTRHHKNSRINKTKNHY